MSLVGGLGKNLHNGSRLDLLCLYTAEFEAGSFGNRKVRNHLSDNYSRDIFSMSRFFECRLFEFFILSVFQVL